MLSGIYCFTNIINNKKYVGQSQSLQQRYSDHMSRAFNPNCNEYDSYFHRALRKYGKDNFHYEVLEYVTVDQLDERERYWIYSLNTLIPHGYNISSGGQSNRNVLSTLNIDDINSIRQLLRTTILTNEEIGVRFNVHATTISGINTGRLWFDNQIEYPIRKRNQIQHTKNACASKKSKTCALCGTIISPQATWCKQCYAVAQRTIERPTKEELFNLLTQHKGNFSLIGRMFNKSDNAIRKWCKSYNLPHHSLDYKT